MNRLGILWKAIRSLDIGWRLIAIIVLGIPILGVFVEISYVRDVLKYVRLKNSGVLAQGVVINHRQVEEDEGPDRYYVTYKFTAQARQFTREQEVKGYRSYQTLAPGTPVEILYLPDNAQVSSIKEELRPAEFGPTLLVFCLILPTQIYVASLVISFFTKVWIPMKHGDYAVHLSKGGNK